MPGKRSAAPKLAKVREEPHGLELDEVELSLSISTDGRVAFVGGGLPGMRGGGASMTPTLRSGHA